MFVRVREIKLPYNRECDLLRNCAAKLCISEQNIEKYEIFRKSTDARRGQIMNIYTVDVYIKEGIKYTLPEKAEEIEQEEVYTINKVKPQQKRPVIVGFGPAGIFCALVLARAGANPIIIERGKCIDERVMDVENFFETGRLDTSSNIQFGEGGAGTFSDGKLNTLVRDKDYRGRFVLRELVKAGAAKEIMYINKPHVGTDMLRKSIQNIRKEIEYLGGKVYFSHKLTEIKTQNGKVCGIVAEHDNEKVCFETECVFLGIGHSARDTFSYLKESGINMERKTFSVGVRIEHKQKLINDNQYNGNDDKTLPAADYKMVCHTKTGRSVYTFCMCPGGYVVAAASEEGGVVTNGMSNFSRDGENANAALLVEVRPDDFEGDDVLSGVYFQRELEKAAFSEGHGEYKAPCETVGHFLHGRANKPKSIKPTYSRGVRFGSIDNVLPEFVTSALREGLLRFDSMIHGFAADDAIMTAVESRSSSPVRIVRDADSMQASVKGLYPIGEGAGYAGGIMSAAMDGMKAAEKYIDIYKA